MSTRVGVVGLGRLGTCLVRAMQRAGVSIAAVASRSSERVAQVTQALGLPRTLATSIEDAAEDADCVFLTVPDSQLAEVCALLGAGPGRAVVHCSGAADVSPLAAAIGRGAAVGVFHPLQSFGPDAGPDRFSDISVGIDAGEPLAGTLAELAERLGARAFSLRGVDRARYHAAAVFASNYVVALHAAAARIWAAAGLPYETARAALAPLSRGAVENIAHHELQAALTGPIARGDVQTIARQLGALGDDPASAALYRALARELVQLPLPHAAELRRELERALAEAEPAEGA